MKKRLVSFAVPYIIVPAVFYLVDMAAQSTFVTGNTGSMILLNVALIVTAAVVFQFLLTQEFVPLRAPFWAAAGSVVGLLHFFQYYMIIGTFWVWKTVAYTGFTSEEKKLLWINLINPFFNYEDMVCDGAAPALVMAAVIFAGLAMRVNRLRKPADA